MRLAVAAILLAAVLSCGAESRESTASTHIVYGKDLVRLGPSLEFSRVRDLVIDEDVVWVLDSSPPFITRIVSDDAQLAIQFGASGRGPGELKRPVAIQLSSDGVDVWDPGNNRVVTFDHHGTVIRYEALSTERTGRIRPDILDVTYLDPWRVRRIGNRIVYTFFPTGVDQAADAIRGSLVVTDARLTSGALIARYADYVPRDATSLGQFAAMPLWDACRDAVAMWDPRARMVRWLDLSGRVLHEAALELHVGEIELDHIERYLRHVARLELGPGFESAGIDFADYARRNRTLLGKKGTTFADLRCESDRSVWLQLFDMSRDPLGRGRAWIRVQQGSTDELVRFPDGFQPLLFADDGTVFGVMDSPGGQSLALWRGAYRSTQ